MKKIILTLSLMLSMTALAETVGYIDYSVMYKNIPISKQLQEKMDSKVQEIRDYNKQTAALSKAQVSPEGKSEVILQRKTALQKLEKEYLDLKYKQDVIVKSKVRAAAQTVMTQKKLDIIVDKKSTVVGGVDCTQEVLKAIR